jgi:hypothetical protein
MTEQLTEHRWVKVNRLTALRNSDFYGFWLRLKKLGFVLHKTNVETETQGNIHYLRTIWFFKRRASKELVRLSASQRSYGLSIRRDKKSIVKMFDMNWSNLEKPFLQYFDQTDRPLYIRRIGEQTKEVRAFQAKLLKHIKDNGKWAQRIVELNAVPPFMPKSTHTTRPRHKG